MQRDSTVIEHKEMLHRKIMKEVLLMNQFKEECLLMMQY